jgi:hypothetical protein
VNPIAQYALAGAILASLFGGSVLCFLVSRYGFAPALDPATGEAFRRLIMLRFGHAVTGVCFAISAILAIVALWVLPSSSTPAPPPAGPSTVELRQEIEALHARVNTLETTLTEINARVGKVLTRLESRKTSSD